VTKLNQLLASEDGVRSKANTEGADLQRKVQKDDLVSGFSRVYTPDEGGAQLPPDQKLVQLRIPEVLDRVAARTAKLFDVVFAKEQTNTLAKADLVVDGQTLLTAVPVTYLLFLGHQLDELAAFIDKLPTLDPTASWTWEENTGLYVTPEVETIQKAKTRGVQILHPPTKEHPAQVLPFTDDTPVGRWMTKRSSGAIFGTRKIELADRVDKLRTAVKVAREAANMIEVTEREAGEVLFRYLFS